MAVKIKELKKVKEKRVFQIPNIPTFIMALNKLVQPTRGDEKRLDEVDETIKTIGENHLKTVQAFFTENNLPLTEEIDISHPLINAWNDFYFEKIAEPKFPEFTENQFTAVTQGVLLTRGEKKLLEFWLVKK